MTVSTQAQALSLAAGLLLGLGIGLFYDLFRILRCRLPFHSLGVTLDLLFWLCTTILLFLYAQAAEGGRVRLYLALALFLGSCLYFRFLSRCFLKIGYLLADYLAKLLRLVVYPFRKINGFLKKNKKIAKNIFSSDSQWYKIFDTLGEVCRYKHHSSTKKGGQKDG